MVRFRNLDDGDMPSADIRWQGFLPIFTYVASGALIMAICHRQMHTNLTRFLATAR